MDFRLPPGTPNINFSHDQLVDIKRRLIAGARGMSTMDLKLSFGLLFPSQTFIDPALYAVPFMFLKANDIPRSNKAGKPSIKYMDKAHRGYVSIIAIASSMEIVKHIEKNGPVVDIMYKGWPGLFAWMQFFFGTVIQREQENGQGTEHSETMGDFLCKTFMTYLSVPRLAKLVASTPDVVALLTHLWVRGDNSELSILHGHHLGSVILNMFLRHDATKKRSAILEMVKTMGGKPGRVATHAKARLQKIVEGSDFTVRQLSDPLQLFVQLLSERDTPVHDALLGMPFIRLIGKTLSRLLEVPFDPNDQVYQRARLLTTLCFAHLKNAMEYTFGIPWVLQCLEAGILESFLNCCPTLFAFNPFESDGIVEALRVLTANLVHFPVARMAIASYKKVSRELPMRRLINKAIPKARAAWIRFQCMVLEREKIIAGLPPSSSTPVMCDYCTKFFERKVLKKCAGCATAQYCSKECQTRAWKEKDHRGKCKLARESSSNGSGFRLSAQEKLFIVRIAINYAQAKEKLVWRMVKGNFKGVKLNISHHIIPALVFVEFEDSKNVSDREAMEVKDDLIGVRKFRAPRVDLPRNEHERVRLASAGPSLVGLVDGESDKQGRKSVTKDGDTHPEDGDGDRTEELEFYEPSEEPDAILRKKRETSISMGISVPLGADLHVVEFIVDDFWSYEGFAFKETKESELEYKKEEGDPSVDKYFVSRRSDGKAHTTVESVEDKIREYDGELNGKEAMAKTMLDFMDVMEHQIFKDKVEKAKRFIGEAGAVKLGVLSLKELEAKNGRAA